MAFFKPRNAGPLRLGPTGKHLLNTGDSLTWLRTLPDDTYDSCVTDPPYGLGKEPDPREVLEAWLHDGAFAPGGKGFMGAAWDAFVPSPALWAEVFRVLKPGAHLLSFAGTRTYDWMVLGIRLAGFEIRDQIAWVYGTGFPKSQDPAKAARKAGIEGVPEGLGTALKPAVEPVVLARKPFKGPAYRNVLAYGTGCLQIDAARVPTTDTYSYPNGAGGNSFTVNGGVDGSRTDTPEMHEGGRWPANLIHDGSDEVLEVFPSTADGGDSDSAARFFYCAKASKSEREAGLDALPTGTTDDGRSTPADNAYQRGKTERKNTHPTVKPRALIAYLQRLVTPPGGLTLDPFFGSGTCFLAAEENGLTCHGSELIPEHVTIARTRLEAALTPEKT